MKSLADIELNGAAACKLFGISNQAFEERLALGWFKPTHKGRYRLGEVIGGHKAFLLDERQRTQKSQAASRVQDARAKRIEIRTQRGAGRLVEAIDTHGFLADTIGAFRSSMAGAAAASSRNLGVRATVEDEVEAALDRLRGRFDAAAAGDNVHPGGSKNEEVMSDEDQQG